MMHKGRRLSTCFSSDVFLVSKRGFSTAPPSFTSRRGESQTCKIKRKGDSSYKLSYPSQKKMSYIISNPHHSPIFRVMQKRNKTPFLIKTACFLFTLSFHHVKRLFPHIWCCSSAWRRTLLISLSGLYHNFKIWCIIFQNWTVLDPCWESSHRVHK